jgi:hypothetical protein
MYSEMVFHLVCSGNQMLENGQSHPALLYHVEEELTG